MMGILFGDGCAHDLVDSGHVCGGVYCGFSVLTSDTRRAIRRLSERLNIDVVPIESMIDQMGKTAGGEFYSICIALMNRICKMPLRCY